ncbi:MAG: hypothetical protein AAF960_25575 [Bacteroidota bacterium]
MYYPTNDIWKGLYSTKQKQGLAIARLKLVPMDIDGKQALSEADYITLLQNRLTTIKTDKGKSEIAQRLKDLGIDATTKPTTTNRKDKSRKPLRAAKNGVSPSWHQKTSIGLIKVLSTVAEFFTAKPIVFVTLVAALSIQVHHLAVLVNRVGDNDGILLGYLFGSVAETTALLLTIHGAQKRTLLIFAFVQAWVNVLYYCDLPLLVTKLTLSALIAYVVFSYSELYTKTNLK